MQNQKCILLVITGHTIEPVRSQFGNTDAHFEQIVGDEISLHRYAICNDWPTTPIPELAQFDGVIMTGSAAMLEDDQPWMKASKKLVEKCLDDAIPFLGVCFGHQVLGAVCGAKVGPNPQGRANGSRRIEVLEPSGIFHNFPPSFWAQISHRDVILENRSEFEVIASTAHDPRHAISVDQKAFGVQFHPEWDIQISRAYINARRDILGEAVAKAMEATLTPSPIAPLVVKQFTDLCRLKT